MYDLIATLQVFHQTVYIKNITFHPGNFIQKTRDEDKMERKVSCVEPEPVFPVKQVPAEYKIPENLFRRLQKSFVVSDLAY